MGWYYLLMVLFSGLVMSMTFQSCKWDNAAELVINECDTVPATYNAVIVPILESYCTDPSFGGCHYAGQTDPVVGDFTDYAQIKVRADNGLLEYHIITVRDMPKSGTLGPTSLPGEEITRIKCWIESGAPNN